MLNIKIPTTLHVAYQEKSSCFLDFLKRQDKEYFNYIEEELSKFRTKNTIKNARSDKKQNIENLYILPLNYNKQNQNLCYFIYKKENDEILFLDIQPKNTVENLENFKKYSSQKDLIDVLRDAQNHIEIEEKNKKNKRSIELEERKRKTAENEAARKEQEKISALEEREKREAEEKNKKREHEEKKRLEKKAVEEKQQKEKEFAIKASKWKKRNKYIKRGAIGLGIIIAVYGSGILSTIIYDNMQNNNKEPNKDGLYFHNPKEEFLYYVSLEHNKISNKPIVTLPYEDEKIKGYIFCMVFKTIEQKNYAALALTNKPDDVLYIPLKTKSNFLMNRVSNIQYSTYIEILENEETKEKFQGIKISIENEMKKQNKKWKKIISNFNNNKIVKDEILHSEEIKTAQENLKKEIKIHEKKTQNQFGKFLAKKYYPYPDNKNDKIIILGKTENESDLFLIISKKPSENRMMLLDSEKGFFNSYPLFLTLILNKKELEKDHSILISWAKKELQDYFTFDEIDEKDKTKTSFEFEREDGESVFLNIPQEKQSEIRKKTFSIYCKDNSGEIHKIKSLIIHPKIVINEEDDLNIIFEEKINSKQK